MSLTSPSFYRLFTVTDISGIINNTKNSVSGALHKNGKIFSTTRR